ncbi:MAG: hypothetical protein LBR18_08905, partial [Tannerella sp.]|nr:hypothetical protein [Tannerella sp.]
MLLIKKIAGSNVVPGVLHVIASAVKQYLSLKIILGLALMLSFAQTTHAVNLYWVGGSGNWGDVNHWATTSGGSVHPSSLPSPDDVVYFDDNSGWTSS